MNKVINSYDYDACYCYGHCSDTGIHIIWNLGGEVYVTENEKDIWR